MKDSPLDDKAAENFFSQIMKIWVEPELDRRLKEGRAYTKDIDRCLILLPPQKEPIVQFNDEGGFETKIKKAPNTEFKPGQVVYMHDIVELLHVRPPKHDGKRVAFVFMILVDLQWRIFFDFSPSWPEYVPTEKDSEWPMGKDIAEAFNIRVNETLVKSYPKQKEVLKKIGLWLVPSLLPYPMSRILVKIASNDDKGARAALVAHCNAKFLQDLCAKWFDVEPFMKRKRLIEGALASHIEGKWDLAMHALIPHMEGIMGEWLKSGPLKNKNLPVHQFDIALKFSNITKKKAGSITYKHLAESSTDFIMGPLLERIEDWKKNYGSDVPNRHIVGHGDYDEKYYSEESSIKVILLLDTIYYLIKQNSTT